MISHLGGIMSGREQESQAGANFVFSLFRENFPRNLFIDSMENPATDLKRSKSEDQSNDRQ